MVLQDLPDASCIASLSGKAGSGNVRGHAMPRHSTPRMISWRWLREPNITCIPSQSSIFQSFHNDIPVTQLPTSSVHHEAALLEEFDGLCVDHVLRFRMQWAIQSDNVHLLDHFLPIRMVMQVVLLLNFLWQTVAVRIVQLHLKGLQSLQNCKSNSPSCHSSHFHPFHIIRSRDAICNIPPIGSLRPLVAWDVVAHESQDHHNNVL
mmetsp:Transcript_149725/g.272201  ORF Transcript_149725/g.272201 Transcript_149725/m.272201 type:complete len:206 (-) Transcript_149725:595-1212(-)